MALSCLSNNQIECWLGRYAFPLYLLLKYKEHLNVLTLEIKYIFSKRNQWFVTASTHWGWFICVLSLFHICRTILHVVDEAVFVLVGTIDHGVDHICIMALFICKIIFIFLMIYQQNGSSVRLGSIAVFPVPFFPVRSSSVHLSCGDPVFRHGAKYV